MTSAPLRCHPAAAAPRAAQVRPAVRGVAERMRADDGIAQFSRFVLVGGVSSALYAVLFLLLAGVGDQPANLAGAVASSMVANELHRRLTFHAGRRVSWFAAQWEGGGLALAGMLATGLALGWLDTTTDAAGTTLRIAVVAAVTGAIGLVRFAALRWVFGARPAGRV